jgi:hypothetical protein
MIFGKDNTMWRMSPPRIEPTGEQLCGLGMVGRRQRPTPWSKHYAGALANF